MIIIGYIAMILACIIGSVIMTAGLGLTADAGYIWVHIIWGVFCGLTIPSLFREKR